MTQFIEFVNSCAVVWWPVVFHATWQSGLIAVPILLMIALGRRWPSPLRYALVMIALIKFLVPPFFAVPTGAFSLLRLPVTPQFDPGGQDKREQAYPAVAVKRESSKQFPLKERPVNDGEEIPTMQQQDNIGAISTDGSIQNMAAVAESATSAQPAVRSAQSLPTRLTRHGCLMLIHLAGGIFVAVCVFIQYVRVARIARGGCRIVEGELDTLFCDAGRKLGLRWRVELRVCNAPIPPLAFGVVRPVVVVSFPLLQRLAKDEQQAILAHELSHHRRWDLWVIWLQSAVIALWWFHPLAWCVNYTLGRLREDCCDDLLLHGGVTTCGRYCNALIRTVEWCAAQSVLCRTTWPVPRMHPFGGRIVRVMDGSLRRSPALSAFGVFMVTLLACIVLPGVTQVAALQTTAKLDESKRVEQPAVAPPPTRGGSPAPRSQALPGKEISADRATTTVADLTARPVDLYGDALPRGAVSRLGTIRYRHPGVMFKRAAFVPNTDTLIVGATYVTVGLWDTRSGKLLHEIDFGDHYFQSFRLTPDGKQIATLALKPDNPTRINSTQLKFWDAKTFAYVSKIEWTEPFSAQSQQIAFTPNGNTVAIGMRNGSVRLANVKTERELKSRAVVRGEIESLAFSPDGDLLAVGSRGGAAIWEWRTDKEPQALPGLPRGAQVIEFSPDGTLFATGSDGSFAARLWDVGTRRLVARLQGNSSSYYREGLAFTSDGRFLAVPVRQDKSVELFDVSTGKLMRKLSTGFAECNNVAISTGDQLIAAVGSQPVIKVWDLKTGEAIGEQFVGHEAEPSEIKFAPDDRQIVSGCHSGMIGIWNVSNGQPVHVLSHNGRWVSLDVSPDGTKIATASHDNTVRLWDATNGRQIFQLAGHGRYGSLYPVQFTPDGNRFLSFGPDGFLRVWDVVTGKAVHEHAIRPGQVKIQEDDDEKPFVADPFGDSSQLDVRLSRFTSDGKFLLWPLRDKVYVFDVISGKQIRQHDAPTGGRHAFSPDGEIMVIAEARPNARDPGAKIEDSKIRLQSLELASGKTKSTFEFPGRFPGEIRFSPNGRLVAIEFGSVEKPNESMISVWEWETSGKEVARITGMTKLVAALAFSHDQKLLAVSYNDSSTIVWDLSKFSIGETAPRKSD